MGESCVGASWGLSLSGGAGLLPSQRDRRLWRWERAQLHRGKPNQQLQNSPQEEKKSAERSQQQELEQQCPGLSSVSVFSTSSLTAALPLCES